MICRAHSPSFFSYAPILIALQHPTDGYDDRLKTPGHMMMSLRIFKTDSQIFLRHANPRLIRAANLFCESGDEAIE